MKKIVTIIGALAATAGAIAPLVTALNPKVGAIIGIIGIACAAFGPALLGSKNPALPKQKSFRRNYKSFGLLMLVILPLSAFTLACSPKWIMRAAQGTLIAGTAIDEVIDIKRDFRASGELSREHELSITHGLLDVDRGLLQITDEAECFEHYTSDVRANLIRSSGDVVNILDNLNRDGVLHIKSTQGQERFRKWLTGARVTVKGIQTALELTPAQDPSAEGQPSPKLTDAQRKLLEEVREICKRAGARLRDNETELLKDIALLEQPAQELIEQ
jgi:hypothetical protein